MCGLRPTNVTSCPANASMPPIVDPTAPAPKTRIFIGPIIAFDKIQDMKRSIVILCIAGFLMGCATVPYTNRKQLNFISEGEEAQLGLQAYQETLSKAKISADANATAMV